jgi:SAM-dependent methyltransferase
MNTHPDVVRPCPFCSAEDYVPFGSRQGAYFVTCVACRSIYMQISDEEFQTRHLDGWADDQFLQQNSAWLGTAPNLRVYREIAANFVDGSPILEIGPGTGHLLAAFRQAGHPVFGVETSAINRRFIMETWSIDTVYETLADIPSATAFGGVIVINTIEHMFAPADFLCQLNPFVAPQGAVFVSTANAQSLSASLYGTIWSMFKPIDHVSLPSAKGFRRLGEKCGYSVDRIWSTEYPLQTIVSGVVAARDYVQESRHGQRAKQVPVATQAADSCHGKLGLSRRLLYLSRRLAFLDPTSRIISALGLGESLKAVYRVPASQV